MRRKNGSTVGKGYKTKAEELEVSDSAEGNVVEGDLAEGAVEGDVSEGDVSEGDVSVGDVSEGDVAEVDVAEVDVAEGDSVEGNNKDEELANKMINFMQDGVVFNDKCLGQVELMLRTIFYPKTMWCFPLEIREKKVKLLRMLEVN